MNVTDIAKTIEISTVQTNHSIEDVRHAAGEAMRYGFAVVYTLPAYTAELAEMLRERPDIAPGGVVSFPSGAETLKIKLFQAEQVCLAGARDLDMVMNVGLLKAGRYDRVCEEIKEVKAVLGAARNLKVIMEVGCLTDDELRRACQLVEEGGADYAKTGTGWVAPTTMHHIDLICDALGGRVKVKASGGVRGLDMLLEMAEKGVSRFGIRSDAAIEIIRQAEQRFGQ